jgi:cytochrome P450
MEHVTELIRSDGTGSALLYSACIMAVIDTLSMQFFVVLHCRSMFEPGFTHERVDALKPSIKQHVTQLIDGMKLQRWNSGRNEVDLHESFSLPLAFKVIYQLLGIPFEASNTDNVVM